MVLGDVMKIEPIPLLGDNYAWLLVADDGRCAVVDPAEAGPVAERVKSSGSKLTWILATHHHWDHVGGIEDLVKAFSGVEVICSTTDRDRVPAATRFVEDGERLSIAGSETECLHVPGHTRGAVAFYFAADSAVFTGDTMFLAGCGRLFEGTPAQMHASLSRLAELPKSTRVYCGHEYTEKNMRFAASVDPENSDVRDRLAAVIELRQAGEITVPALLADECSTSPFLRLADPVLQKLAGSNDPVTVFAELRRRRDSF